MPEKAAPLYHQISEILRTQIVTGRVAVGGVLPTEMEHIRSFKASRSTVRHAIRALAEDGMVRTLHDHAYVRRIPESGRNCLGLAVVHLAQAFLRSFELRDVMRPFLRELYDVTHETISHVV